MSWRDRAKPVTTASKASSWRDRAKPLEAQVSELESGLRGAAQGASLGFADEITGALESLYDVATTEKELSDIQDLYKQNRDESRLAYQAAESANPGSFMTGNVAGSVATAFVPGLNVAKAGTLAGRVGLAAAQGAAAGLGTSTEDNLAGLAKDTAIGAGLGAGFQGIGEKILAPAVKTVSNKTPDLVSKAAAKGASLFTGVDEDAALRQIMRPAQSALAEADDFSYKMGNKALEEIQDRGQMLGENVGKAKDQFLRKQGSQEISEVGDEAARFIDEFLDRNAPSQKGFSALTTSQTDELSDLSKVFKGGEITGEDLLKSRERLDFAEKLAGKYDKEGTGPYINFLKSLRHKLDENLDRISPEIDNANKAFSGFQKNKQILGINSEARAESIIDNLYGKNKTAKQRAAEQILKPNTIDSLKDVAANKAFDAAKGPAGSEFGARRIGANVVGGVAGSVMGGPVGTAIGIGAANALVSPNTWKYGLRGLGKTGQALGKYGPVLERAAQRGQQSLAATNFILQQTDPDYRETLKRIQEEEQEGQ